MTGPGEQLLGAWAPQPLVLAGLCHLLRTGLPPLPGLQVVAGPELRLAAVTVLVSDDLPAARDQLGPVLLAESAPVAWVADGDAGPWLRYAGRTVRRLPRASLLDGSLCTWVRSYLRPAGPPEDAVPGPGSGPGPGPMGSAGVADRGLSTRQLTVLRLLSDGWEQVEIAARLGCSLRTVKKDLAGACERLAAVNGAHAVRQALAVGLVGR